MKIVNVEAPDWAGFGPTMEGHEVERVGKFRKSKRHEMMNPDHPRHDPDFPKGFPISNAPRAKRLWWTREVAAWLEKRAEQYRKLQEETEGAHGRTKSNRGNGGAL